MMEIEVEKTSKTSGGVDKYFSRGVQELRPPPTVSDRLLSKVKGSNN